MALGFGVLRLPPDAFWAMSLPELLAATRGLRGDFGRAPALGRPQLAALMARFPDVHPSPHSKPSGNGRHHG
jgi:uncharacterized phage protein (TIGR02216 family)